MTDREMVRTYNDVSRWPAPKGVVARPAIARDRGTVLVTIIRHRRAITYECVERLAPAELHRVLDRVAGMIPDRRPVVATAGIPRD